MGRHDSVRQRTVNVGGVDIELREQHGGCGQELWPCGKLLLEWMLRSSDIDLTACGVFEIGAGVGLTSMGLAKSGCKTVIASDSHSGTLKNLRFNCQNNGLGKVRVLKWDWSEGQLPEKVDWNQIQFCVGADLVYPSAGKHLVNAIGDILKAASHIEVLMMTLDRQGTDADSPVKQFASELYSKEDMQVCEPSVDMCELQFNQVPRDAEGQGYVELPDSPRRRLTKTDSGRQEINSTNSSLRLCH
eukprot:127968-Pyramimonas_sp.AAC.1